nr:putative ribonuclease H-like domain-containing protein [Tanacetum cinerariifolium]
MIPFGYPITILNTLDPLGKFDGKADEGFMVGYSVNSNSFREFNIVAENQPNHNAGIQENLNACKVGKETVSAQQYVLLPLWSTGSQDPQNTDNDVTDAAFDDKDTKRFNAVSAPVNAVGPNLTNSTNSFNTASSSNTTVNPNFGIAGKSSSFMDPSKYPDDPDMPELEDIVYSDDEEDVGAEADLSNLETNIFVSPIPTTRVHKDHPVNQIIDLPKGKRAIGSKWVFRNKKDERGIVIRNEARLVTQGHTQEEGIDYDEVFAPVARIEAIHLFLAYVSFMGFMVYQMDVKSAFLYRTIEEEVYICQPLGFDDPDYPDKVYKVVKALYGLHQAPRAWYETLANYLLENGFQKGKIDQTLFIKKQKGDILLVQDKFQMSSIGELTFFLGLQVKQKDDGIFISQDKYVAKILRKFGFINVKSASTLIEIEKPLLKDPDGEDVDVHIYSDYAGASLDRKSTTGGSMDLKSVAGLWGEKSSMKLLEWNLHYQIDKKDGIGVTAGDLMFILLSILLLLQDLHLDDADGVECLPNEEIFVELARMGYEKPPPKLTFYKAFFSAQWKFLIHTLVQCVSAKRTAWNEFSYLMASAVICLVTGRNFNFSKYIFDSMVMNVDSPSKFLMYLRFLQVVINNEVNDLTSHNTKYTSPALTHKVFANMQSVGKGFLGVETPLFASMLVQPQPKAAEEEDDVEVPTAPTPPSPINAFSPVSQDPTPTPHTTPAASPPQEQPTTTSKSTMSLMNTLMETCASLSQKVAELEHDKHTQALEILKLKKRVKKLEKKKGRMHPNRREDDQDVSDATKDVNAAEPTVFDDEKVIMTMDQTLIKMKAEKSKLLDEQIAQSLHDEEVEKAAARDKQEKDDLERAKKPVSIAQAKKNMIIYLKNMVGYKMKHFRGMTYDKECFKKLKAVEVSGSDSTQETPSNDPKEIKKDYPLSNGVMTLMLSAKLQVEEDSEMARDLVMKIFMEANKPKSRSLDTSYNITVAGLRLMLLGKVDTAAEVTEEIILKFRFRIDFKSLNKVSVLVVLDLSKVANPLYSLRDKDLLKLNDPHHDDILTPNIPISDMGGVFVRDHLLYDYEILSEIPNVDLVSLDFHLGLKPLKCDTNFDDCVQCGVNNDHVLHVYAFHSEFNLNETTTEQNLRGNDDSVSDLEEDDYNVYDYCNSKESDTSSIVHLSDGEEEVLDVRTKKVDPAPKKKARSTCKLGVEHMPDGKAFFCHFYVCFKALKEGCKRGIIEAGKDVMPLSEHRQCARHIYPNFKKKFTSVQFRSLFWQAPKATYPAKFEKVMQEIKNLSKEAHKHLMNRHLES